ncbi:hypothetical protein SDC9_82083 [bioreactor metagenome]|uniref:Uncharacterized protein n=1 Tax=bioreactor metagenome TaxID=1076179 RepID=A0A644Z3M9_9ZZZZ
MIGHDFALGRLNAPDENAILVGAQAYVVPHADGGDDDAQVNGALSADHNNPIQQVAAQVHIHQGDDAISKLQLQLLHLQENQHVFRLALRLRQLLGGVVRGRRRLLHLLYL